MEVQHDMDILSALGSGASTAAKSILEEDRPCPCAGKRRVLLMVLGLLVLGAIIYLIKRNGWLG